MKSYRLEKHRLDGTFCGCEHFSTLERAEAQLKRHNYIMEYSANVMQSDKRYGTIWVSELCCNN